MSYMTSPGCQLICLDKIHLCIYLFIMQTLEVHSGKCSDTGFWYQHEYFSSRDEFFKKNKISYLSVLNVVLFVIQICRFCLCWTVERCDGDAELDLI